jgi:hypothetical protein
MAMWFGGHRGEYLQVPSGLSRLGNRDFAFRMKGFLRAERTKNDGAAELLAEQFHAQVDFAALSVSSPSTPLTK